MPRLVLTEQEAHVHASSTNELAKRVGHNTVLIVRPGKKLKQEMCE